MALRCVSLTVPVADSEASSERRVRTSVTLPSAFSPIASEEMPSLALRTAWAATRTSRSSLSAIARPAASSEALLMRSPDDSRSSDAVRLSLDSSRWRCALSEARFVLTVIDID